MKIDQDLNEMTGAELFQLREKVKTMPCIVCGNPPCNFREIEINENTAFVTICTDHQLVTLDVLKDALLLEMATIEI
jgi:hypothetical protein